MSITITDEDLHYIYTVFGYPIVNISDIGVLTEQAIKDYVIEPTLKEYFRWFPIRSIQEISVSSGTTSGSVDFPDQYTYGVLDCKFTLIQDSDVYANLDTLPTNPIFSFRNITKRGGGRNLGSQFDYGFNTIQKSTAWKNDSMAEASQVFRRYINHENRSLDYFSQQAGWVVVTWAKWSDDCSDVMFRYQKDFLDLCKAELKLYWAEFLNKVDTEFPSSFDGDTLKEEGQELKDKIMEKWANKTKPVMIRS